MTLTEGGWFVAKNMPIGMAIPKKADLPTIFRSIP